MEKITVSVIVKAKLEKVWDTWNNPKHIVNWNFAWDDWSCSRSSNDLRVWGRINSTMAARDGSMSFDFEWEYTRIIDKKIIEFTMVDMQYWEHYIKKWRKVSVLFEKQWNSTKIIETFDAEEIHSLELQREWWQSILDRFKKYTESL